MTSPLFFINSIIVALSIQPFLSTQVKQGIFTIGMIAKSLILLVLPVVIFGIIFRSSLRLVGNTSRLLYRLFLGVLLSTFASVVIGLMVGRIVYDHTNTLSLPTIDFPLVPLWSMPAVDWIKNEWALLCGLALGVATSLYGHTVKDTLGTVMDRVVQKALKIISIAMPLFIFGSIIKIANDGLVWILAKQYTVVFLSIIISISCYITTIYCFVAQWSWTQAILYMRAILPAAMNGMVTMSSAASLPLLISGVTKNTKNENISHFVAPIAANVHMVGECIANLILAYAILKTYTITPPSMSSLTLFVFFFVLSRFACAGVPGGGTLVTLPLFKKYFGFDVTMASLLATLNLLMDPLITWGNLMGDGALCQWITHTKHYDKSA
jgi:Na+/H+-dicarboxylate symporter